MEIIFIILKIIVVFQYYTNINNCIVDIFKMNIEKINYHHCFCITYNLFFHDNNKLFDNYVKVPIL